MVGGSVHKCKMTPVKKLLLGWHMNCLNTKCIYFSDTLWSQVFLYDFTDTLYFSPFTLNLRPQTKWKRMDWNGAWGKYGIQININNNNNNRIIT